MTRVLVLAPHPDDEAIGCGGTLRKHSAHGDEVRVVFLTSGEGGGHGRPPAETASLREAEAAAAAEILGLGGIEFWRERDGAIRPTPELVCRLAATLDAFRPDILYLPHDRESHADHRASTDLVRASLVGRADRPDVLMFEVWTPLELFDHVEDITAEIAIKAAAIRAHASQCAVMAFDDAAIGLSRYRGEMHSWPDGEYAEVFRRLR
ncbi:MAG TPA: PIG-L family deacetylase [Gemmataceae bacterium]|jgi:LmbE family N-acetylglucosaminyl deacetylase|nr:PIG-L family deacetylase [Gemmataceae bacterium]